MGVHHQRGPTRTQPSIPGDDKSPQRRRRFAFLDDVRADDRRDFEIRVLIARCPDRHLSLHKPAVPRLGLVRGSGGAGCALRTVPFAVGRVRTLRADLVHLHFLRSLADETRLGPDRQHSRRRVGALAFQRRAANNPAPGGTLHTRESSLVRLLLHIRPLVVLHHAACRDGIPVVEDAPICSGST